MTPDTKTKFTIASVLGDPESAVLTVDGELRLACRDELKRLCLDRLANGVKNLTVDLSRCGYVDSSGLGGLVSIQKKFHEEGYKGLILHNVNEDLKDLLEFTKLDMLFTITSSAEE